jgi:NADH-quinone oxidoreductase subunit H
VKRFVGMVITFAVLLVAFVGLGWAFYKAAAGLAWAFGLAGLPPAWGAGIANVVTLMMVVAMASGSLLSVAERKWSALIQNRVGANRIKVFGSALGGIPFLVADAIKMLTKERFLPAGRVKFLFDLAPVLAFAPVLAVFAVVPVGPPIAVRDVFAGVTGAAANAVVSLQVASPDAGLLYIFAISSLAVFGTSLAGYSSNNKFALLGGVRASSQMISYEVSLGLALVGTMLAFRTLRLEEIVAAQGTPVLGGIPAVGLLLQPVGFLVYFASAVAETKRAPFDIPEGESEIVGYNVEYSGMQWGMMFLTEFIEVAVLSGFVTALFLGGWQPILFQAQFEELMRAQPLLGASLGAGIFLAKMFVMMWVQYLIRWLLPRFRFDQVQKLCWKILLPTSLANIFVTAAAVLIDPSLQLLAWIGAGTLAVIVALIVWAGRAPAPAGEHGHGPAHAHASGH